MKRSLWRGAAVAAALAQAAGAAGQTGPGQDNPVAPSTVQTSTVQTRTVPANTALAGALPSPVPKASLASQLRAIVDAAQQDKLRKNGSDPQKIADFYASFMDIERIDKLGYRPLIAELQRIRVLRDRRGLPHVIAHFMQLGVPMPYRLGAVPDPQQGTHYVATLLPVAGSPQLARQDAAQHIEKLMALAGHRAAAEAARAAVDLETQLARLQAEASPATAAQLVAIDKLAAMAPSYDWQYALGAAGIAAKTDSIAVADPGFLKGFARIAAEADLEGWKAYLEWHLLHHFAPYLSKEFAGADAAFFGRAGRDRGDEGVRVVSAALRDPVGKQYVAQYLPADRKARLERMVGKQLDACREPFARLGGNELAARLATLRPQLGAPARWRDTNSLMVTPNDLIANVMRASQQDYTRLLSILGKPVDPDDWPVGAQSGDLVYDAQRNVLILPAGALQALPDEEPGRTNLLGSMIGNAIAATMDNSVVAAQLKQACSTPIHR